MKKFRVKNLTVAVGSDQQLKRCGVNFSCPGGAGSFCGITNYCRFPTKYCDGITIHCFTGSVNCGPEVTLGCPAGSIGCLVTKGGCGLNYSTLPPTDFTHLVQELDDVTAQLELIDVMKADLKLAMENLGEVEQSLEQAAQPQTLEEAKEVEANLESALAEVKGLVKKLK